MPEIGPTETPFTALRLPSTPLAPRPGFADELRRHLDRSLRSTTGSTTGSGALSALAVPPTRQETPMSTATTHSASAAAPSTMAPLTPYLAVAGAAAAIDWYREVLGAIETTRFVGDDGRVGHAEMTIGTSRIMLADEFPEIDVVGPRSVGGTTVALHLEVVDVDYTYERAVAAGAEGQRPPADQGHGNRNATILDPFGHRWMVSQPIENAENAGTTGTTEVETGGSTWTVTGRQPVEPGYLVLHTGDLDRAQAFYGALFDWEFDIGGAGGGHVANTRFPLGIAPPDNSAPGTDTAGSSSAGSSSAGAAPAGSAVPTATATTIYFRVDDLDVYAERVDTLGGTILVRNDYPSGGNVECTDDQGYRFDLWKPAPGY